jgi:hypothetical protein
MTGKDTPSDELVAYDRDEALALLSGLGSIETVDPAEISASILRRIFEAETEAETFAETETWSSKDLIGVAFEVSDARLMPSKFGNGKGAYVAADIVRLDTGERGILTTSAARVAGRIYKLKLEGWLPRKVKVTVAVEATADGFQVLNLESVL